MTRQPQYDQIDSQEPISRDECRHLADVVLKVSPGEHTVMMMTDSHAGTTRFANNQVVQNVHSRRVSLGVTVAFGRQHGTATATDFGDEAIRDMVRRAAEIARVSPIDPEYMPPLPPQDYAAIPTVAGDTATAGVTHRLAIAADAVDRCKAERLSAAGVVSSSLSAVGVAASSGLFAYEPRSEARFSLTAMRAEASGWAANVHRSLDGLGAVECTRVAIDKAKQAANPTELPPGRYTVILEPAAVAGLLGPMIWMLDAKSFYKRTSPFAGKLGRRIIDSRLTLRNRPDHPNLLGNGFNSEGIPADDRMWIENGVLNQLRYDRFTAQEHHVYPTAALDAPYLFGTPLGRDLAAPEAAGAPVSFLSREDLIAGTARGILVTNFWYIRTVNLNDLTLTGMTRDGTFLIEEGRVSAPLVNFRWHESPLRALSQVEAFTASTDAVSNENWKMQLPAMKLCDFNFSSVTKF